MTSEQFPINRNLAENIKIWLDEHPQGGYIQLEGDMLTVSDQAPSQPKQAATPSSEMSKELIEQIKQALFEKHNVRSSQQAYAKIGEPIGGNALSISQIVSGLTKLNSPEYATLQTMLEELRAPEPKEVAA